MPESVCKLLRIMISFCYQQKPPLIPTQKGANHLISFPCSRNVRNNIVLSIITTEQRSHYYDLQQVRQSESFIMILASLHRTTTKNYLVSSSKIFEQSQPAAYMCWEQLGNSILTWVLGTHNFYKLCIS